MTRPTFRAIFERLLRELGPQHWWPAETPFEMMIGAVLTQNTAWRNVERSIGALRAERLLAPDALAAANPDRLRAAIRPSGFMTAKAAACARLAEWTLVRDALRGGVARLTDETLRADLLDIRGVGPETADAIMLYAFDRPRFVWDAYARRLLAASGYDVPGTYEAARRQLGAEFAAAGFNLAECQDLHGLIVEAGKRGRQASRLTENLR